MKIELATNFLNPAGLSMALTPLEFDDRVLKLGFMEMTYMFSGILVFMLLVICVMVSWKEKTQVWGWCTGCGRWIKQTFCCCCSMDERDPKVQGFAAKDANSTVGKLGETAGLTEKKGGSFGASGVDTGPEEPVDEVYNMFVNKEVDKLGKL